MPRKLTASSSLDNLRKEAKRWLRAVRENDAEARQRLLNAYPNAPAEAVLRDVQHALALEYGHLSWNHLKQALQSRPEAASAESALTARFLEYACPDHHVRGLPAHRTAGHAALRLLRQEPQIAKENIYCAVVCGNLEEVARILKNSPELANTALAASGDDRSGAGGAYDFLADLGAKTWTPLLYLCFTRLSLAQANDNAVAIARLLLDHGADPNAFFMAGNSRYTPLVGVIGEGEEDRPAHPRRDELARLLLERGAEPYDSQVVYNILFHGKILWWMRLMYEFSVQAGRRADWDDPDWHMLDQGGYGCGARWHLRVAVLKNDLELAEWCLLHGANPNAAPEGDQRLPQRSLYEQAVRLGHMEAAELLARHGAVPVQVQLDEEEEFVAAALRLDRGSLAQHPEFLHSTKALFEAARQDRADVLALLLDLGAPIELQDDHQQRALHVAAANDAVHAAQLLIEHGAEVDPYETRYGNTPLDFAVYHEHPRMIQLLVPHSRDVWNLASAGAVDRLRDVLAAEPELAKISYQTTPLFHLPAEESAALEVAALLLKHGADAGFRSKKDGSTAADAARRLGMIRVAALLDAPAEDAPSEQGALDRVAQDFVDAYEGDAAALERWNQHYGRQFTREDLLAEIWRRNYAFRQRSSRVPKNYLKLEEAQIILAQDAGYGSWAAMIESKARVVAFEIDDKDNNITPRRRLNEREWAEFIATARERRITGIESNGLMTDAVMTSVAGLDQVTRLHLGGSRELSDDGLLQLARMPQLEHLELSEYPGGRLTDRGLAVLRHLPNLRRFEMTWQRGITDAGIANLRFCEKLERVDLMGSPTGDGAIEALQGKQHLHYFSSGRLVTDAGLPLLHNFPLLKRRPGEGLVSHLLIDGPFTDMGLAGLAGLEGVSELDLFWHVTGITSAGFAHLGNLPNLASLGCDGELSNDEAMRHLAAMPSLQRLRAQESVATDDGFEALSKSKTLEFFWGRVCPNFGSRGFVAFSQLPKLRGLGIGCANVDDQALSTLPRFPALRELTPVDVKDDGFRHVGRCLNLERLTCMYCRESGDIATGYITDLPLKYYYAGLTKMTDRSLELLGGMPKLEQVELYECNGVTDAGLPFLAQLPNLREVHLDGLPGVTLEGTKVFPARVRVKYST